MDSKRKNKGKKKRREVDPTTLKAQRIARDLSAEELEECKQAFKMFDKNGDGSISVEEMSTVLQILGNNPSPSDIKHLMQDLDSNDNGEIEFEEFLILMSKHLKAATDEERELREAFEMFDRDGNHFIDSSEIRYVMKHTGEKLSDAQVDELFSWADVNGDGKIDYEEFVKLMTRRR